MKHYYLVKIGSFNVLNSVMKKELLMGLFFGVVVSFWWKKESGVTTSICFSI